MKIFMIIYIAGKIGMTIGPLPYGLEECIVRAADIMAQANPQVITPEGYTSKDVSIECELHFERPALEFK